VAPDAADRLAVRAAVASLPPRQRAVLVLRYFDDLSVADAAAALDCAEGTVKSLTHQAIAALRDRLAVTIDLTAEEVSNHA
jgi:RNA polymerase sigma factor (sigma-70 family)